MDFKRACKERVMENMNLEASFISDILANYIPLLSFMFQ